MRSSWALEAGGRHGTVMAALEPPRVLHGGAHRRHAERVLLVVVGHTGGASRLDLTQQRGAVDDGAAVSGSMGLGMSRSASSRLKLSEDGLCRTPCSRAGTGRRPQRPPAATAAGHTGR